MNRTHAVVALAAAGVLAAASASFAANTPAPAVVSTPATVQDRYGIVRWDPPTTRWIVSAGAGLTGVTCAADGVLTVGFTPLTTVGTYVVDEDDAYAGRFHAGAAMGTERLTVVFRNATTGAVVPCHSSALRIAGSSLQILIRGTGAGPTPPPVTEPTRPPATTAPVPTSPAPTSQVPTPPTVDPTTDAPPPTAPDTEEPDPADQ